MQSPQRLQSAGRSVDASLASSAFALERDLVLGFSFDGTENRVALKGKSEDRRRSK